MNKIYFMLDLSYLDINGNIVKRQETANCYIIHEPGNYYFPLVYGNGNMYIGQNRVDEAVEWKNYLPELINWDSSREFIKNIYIDSGALFFTILTVPKEGANYIIALKDIKLKIILWSWHIWLWKDKITVSECGLWKEVDLGTKIFRGERRPKLYQWGRKDPFPPGGILKGDIKKDRSGDCISNPLTYYTCKITSDHFWSDYIKTIYDPCPPGYKVPNSNILRDVSKFDNNDLIIIKNKGVKINKIDLIFWITGFRGIGIGGHHIGRSGRYWSSKLEDLAISTIKYNVVVGFEELADWRNGFAIRPQKTA